MYVSNMYLYVNYLPKIKVTTGTVVTTIHL